MCVRLQLGIFGVTTVRTNFWYITFPKFVEFLKRSTGKVDSIYFFIFCHEDALELCLKYNECSPMYAYKSYAYIKESVPEEKFGDDLSSKSILS